VEVVASRWRTRRDRANIDQLFVPVRAIPQRLGADSASANVRSALAACLVLTRRYAEAEPLLLEAEAAMRANVDVLRPTTMSRLIWLYEQWGRSDDAAKWRAQIASKTSTPE
jgi:thioredoxin-like negative regulator of GroEL